MKIIKVTCAIIEVNNKVLVVQRSELMAHPLKWEFPGGKIEAFESAEESIHREIKEELDVEIEIMYKITPTLFHYPDISIQLIPFVVNYSDGEVKLKEHAQFRLMNKKELVLLDWADADIAILNEYLTL